MLDATRTYPLLRGRRRREHPLHRLARGVAALFAARATRWGLAAALLLALVGGGVWLARRAEAPDAATALADSAAALRRGNLSAARNHALDAMRADPTRADAHLAAARAYLRLGEGLEAEGAVNRALAAGLPATDARAVLAEAALLQDDSARALTEAARATGPTEKEGRRVRARALAAQGDTPAAIAILRALVAPDAANAAAWRDLGRILYTAGDLAAASQVTARALAAAPGDPEALTLSGELVRSRYGLVGALPWFEAALERDAYFHPALIEYAATLGDLGRNADMLAVARRATAARPGSVQALYLLATLAARAGRYDLSRSLLARAQGRLDDMPGALLLGGALDYVAGKPQQAIGRWRELVGRQPMNLAARRLLGSALLRAGDARGALDTLRPIALRADADSYTLTLVARAFEARGERDWAARFLDRAARAGAAPSRPFGNDDSLAVLAATAAEAPANPSAAIEYVRGLLDNGRDDDALARARAMAAAAPGAPAAQLLAGDVLMARGGAGEALGYYRRAADLDFAAPTLLRVVEASAAAAQPRAAADALALYLGQAPTSLVARRVSANLELQARDWAAAIATLEALRTDVGPRDAALLLQLSRAYAGAEDATTALPYARAAYRLLPMSAAASDAYGWALYLSGDVAGGLQLARKAVALAPGDASIRWHLAQLLAEAGRRDEARAAIAAALADPAFPDRRSAEALLRAL